MKRVIILVVLFIAAVSYTSCNKSSECEVKEQNPSLDHLANRNGSATQIWWVPFQRCDGDPKDCGPETVIVAKRPRLEALLTAIDDGPQYIAAFFRNTGNWDVFPQNYPSTQQMAKLSSGNYNIMVVEGSNQTYYFLCGPTHTLRNDNPEFVVQATYKD
jgi:hypothetical protein